MSGDHVAAYVFDEGDRVRDDDVLSALKAVADAENIVLVLGTLCVHAAGWAGASTSEQPPYGLSQGTFEDPIMGSLYTTKFKVKNLTDIRGKPARNGFRLILGEDNLVPEVPFSGIEPDRQQAHPFTGEVSIAVTGYLLTKNQPGRRAAGILYVCQNRLFYF